MMRISSALIGPLAGVSTELESSLIALGVALSRNIPYYPESAELGKLLRAVTPDVLFVSTDQPTQMETTIEQAASSIPNLPVILLDRGGDHETLRRAMQLGVRECVSAPFELEELRGAVERTMIRRLSQGDSASASSVYSFLPAKAGVGAST